MSAAPIGVVVSAFVAADVVPDPTDGYFGDLIGVGGLAGVIVFLFRWAQIELAKARAEGSQAVRDLKNEHKAEIKGMQDRYARELEIARADADMWQNRYLDALTGQDTKEEPS